MEAVARATCRKVTQTCHSSAFDPQWFPITQNHIQTPWPSTLCTCRSFRLSSACYSLAWTLLGNAKYIPPGICTCRFLSLECPLTGQESTYLFPRLQWKVLPTASPSCPPRASSGAAQHQSSPPPLHLAPHPPPDLHTSLGQIT